MKVKFNKPTSEEWETTGQNVHVLQLCFEGLHVKFGTSNW